MNWVDLVMLGIVVLSALAGFMRGFAREMLGLGAWIVAGILASRLYEPALPVARRWIGDPLTADIVCFVVVFIVILVLLSVLASVLSRLVRISLLGGLDRILGAGFGLARGAALLVLAYIMLALLLPADNWPEAIRHARGLPAIDSGARYALARTPERWRPDLPPLSPPNGPDAAPASGQGSF